MKEVGILMSGPMMAAYIDGRKTETRRAIKGIPKGTTRIKWYSGIQIGRKIVSGWFADGDDRLQLVRCRYGSPGDTAWFRETFGRVGFPERTVFRADPADNYQWDKAKSSQGGFRWIPAIHMPRAFCRASVPIAQIEPQRLLDITPEQAINEGLKCLSKDGGRTYKYGIPDLDGMPGNDDHGWHWDCWSVDPVEAYLRLFAQINGVESVQQNPFVWRIVFPRLEKKVSA